MCLHYCISCRSLESLLQKIWFTYSFFVDYFYANIYFIIIVLTYYITTIYEYEYWALELKWVEWVVEYLLVKWFSLSEGVSIKELNLKLIIITKKLKSMWIYPFNTKKGIQLVRSGQAIRLYQLFRYNQFGRLSQAVSRSEGLIQSFSIRTE